MEEKIRVSREKRFLQNKDISDIAYLILFMAASYDPIHKDYRTIKTKEINYSKLTEGLNITRQTFSKHIKKLIEEEYITVEGDMYILPIPQEFYFDVDEKTLRKLTNFAKQNSIKIYVWLLGWYTAFRAKGREYNFSLDDLCKQIGLAPRQTRNREIIKDILDMLERLGLIEISSFPDYQVEVNGQKTYHYRLIYARDSLPEKSS